MCQPEGRLTEIFEGLRQGAITRREFIARATALGIGGPMALCLVNSIGIDGVSAKVTLSGRPSTGTDEQTRGEGGELRVRLWFAPEHAFAHLPGFPPSASEVSSLILEPLLSYAPDGSLLANLVTEVPTKENGGLSEDLTAVTLNLKEGVLWSDGEPFTADDVVWTWQWITDDSNGSVNRWLWEQIRAVEVVNLMTVQVIYAKPTLVWFAPIAGAYGGSIIPSHLWSGKEKETANAEFSINPIGTGPYKIDTFVPADHAVLSINEHYREPNKPYFAKVRFQGGGDPASVAQAVLQTGDWDAAWNLQVMPAILRELESAGGTGKLVAGMPTYVERIVFNFSDPKREIDGERSSLRAPHPFLTDRAVRKAMAMAIDREALAAEIFSDGESAPAARNILTGIPSLESPNTSFEFNIEAANNLLDEAGWVREGETRAKDGIELEVSFYTALIDDFARVFRFRQEMQEAVKQAWEAIGIKVQFGQIAAALFFDTSPENEYSFTHFYQDVQMYSNGPTFPVPDMYFVDWYAGPDQSNVAQKANEWSGGNIQRYVNPDFDVLYEEVSSTTDPERAAALFVQMNDLVVGDFADIPLFARPFGGVHALSNRLAAENVGASSWEPLFWNIANWRTVEV
jgi:peptide/nickel transport system substrate-binding protein